jgi:hypothetical protein
MIAVQQTGVVRECYAFGYAPPLSIRHRPSRQIAGRFRTCQAYRQRQRASVSLKPSAPASHSNPARQRLTQTQRASVSLKQCTHAARQPVTVSRRKPLQPFVHDATMLQCRQPNQTAAVSVRRRGRPMMRDATTRTSSVARYAASWMPDGCAE